jgi:PTH1 family peptidyl-tRNA hydrolase
MQKFLIVGLGNPGEDYKHTRHNIGFDIADAWALKKEVPFETLRLADATEFSLKGRKITLIKPNTYMNLSGKAVRYWLEQTSVPIENLLVLVDEIALPLSKIRINPKGSDGGHNGLKDIQEKLQTISYPRLRFGIGNTFAKGHQTEYVLGKWSPEEWEQVKTGIEKSIQAIECFILEGIQKSMNTFNR